MLHEGELLLDECKCFGIGVWISDRTGRLCASHASGRPYFVQALHKHSYAVKLAIAHREAQE